MEIVLRATAIFFFIWLLMRALGKRELAELSAFELVLLVTIGDFVQQGVTQEDMSVTGAMMAAGTIGFWVLAFSYIGFRWNGTRKLILGVPAVIVRDGEVLEEVLRIERMPLDEVHEAARQDGIADLADVRLAILEPDGRISFIRDHDDGTEGGPPERPRT
jgi:uncharacterized membrane protein YcaP (DUF421 family)